MWAGNTLVCSCSRYIHEIDVIYCEGCGDVACYDCMVDCSHCSKGFCKNCASNDFECIKCNVKHSRKDVSDLGTVFIVIDGKSIPVKNKDFLVNKTEEYFYMTLNLNGKEYEYMYRMAYPREEGNLYDYFIYFGDKQGDTPSNTDSEESDEWYEYYKYVNSSS